MHLSKVIRKRKKPEQSTVFFSNTKVEGQITNHRDISQMSKLSFVHNGERNLNYVNQSVLQRRWLQLHHAGGNCIWGLLYRRIDEVEMFCYGDYKQDGRNNKYGMSYPSCIY